MNLLKALQGVEQGGQGDVVLTVEDVFSTYLYTGTGAALGIVNDIDLSTEDGMVWIKNRDAADTHVITDTIRGAGNTLTSETDAAEVSDADTITAFGTTGFTLGADVKVNTNTEAYASWTFRKAPRFFDVVTYTGNGVAGREIAHDLGVAPGMIITKVTSTINDWFVYHKSTTATDALLLNTIAASSGGSLYWNNTEPTDSVFSLGSGSQTNNNFNTYIAYLFADDPLGPSGDGSDGMIACGGYTAVSNPQEITIGWEPQYVLVKKTSAIGNWEQADIMRGITTGGFDGWLIPNTNAIDYNTVDIVDITPTGFIQKLSASGDYIYMAIRRPMKTPTSAGEVFAIDTKDGSTLPAYKSGFVTDASITRNIDSVTNNYTSTRLAGTGLLQMNSTGAEATAPDWTFDYMNGFNKDAGTDTTFYSWMWKRAQGFFDVVTYTGTGGTGLFDHSLGVIPEMIWFKNRDGVANWIVYTSATTGLILDSTNKAPPPITWFNSTAATSTQFTIRDTSGSNTLNAANVAYLFATLAGISKVGSYIGDGTTDSSNIIDCGFSVGSKFVLIKRTDEAGDWWFVDTMRGFTKMLQLNTTSAEQTITAIVADNLGFAVTQEATANLNVNTATYIYYAIAV